MSELPSPTIGILFNADPRPAVIIGGGSSLDSFDFKELASDDYFTVVINDQMFIHQGEYIPDFWIFSETSYVTQHLDDQIPPTTKVLVNMNCFTRICEWRKNKNHRVPPWWETQVFTWLDCGGFPHKVEGRDPETGLFTWSTNAVAGTDFARRRGAPLAALLGMDCTRTYHNQIRRGSHKERDYCPQFDESWSRYKQWRDHRNLDYEVYNCSPITKDQTNPRKTWEEWKTHASRFPSGV